ncbi:hypothetical protein BCR42DRAFT_400610 [Absidia repens]|uniref:Uncharacterized protein n=1 Tax=Absidia repens TaxID=90262 RepID=A0A1X2J1B4_9FUNG|nr:hypothetical protein BCR42DRAFT_400610 [Absidia repens]
MNPASPLVTFTPNHENKKRKSNMEDSFMALPSKRINTGYDSPDSMTMIEDDATMNQVHPFPEAVTTTTATAINIPSIPVDNRASNMDYHLSLNATTPAYAPCDTSYGMSESHPRPSTPPFSMTLAHYNEASGGYTSSHIGF